MAKQAERGRSQAVFTLHLRAQFTVDIREPAALAGGIMETQPGKVYQLKLTPKQQQEIRELTGKDSETVSLTVEELEERILPGWTNN